MAEKNQNNGNQNIEINNTIIVNNEVKKNENEEIKCDKTGKQAVKYFIFMCSAGVIEFLSYLLFINFLPIDHSKTIHFINEAQLYIFVSELISLALSIIWNFTFNRKYTFKSCNNVPVSMTLAFLFYVPFYPFALWFVPTLTPIFEAMASTAFWAGVFIMIPKLLKMVINGVLEFMWQKFIIYGKFGNWLESKISNKKVNKKM